VKVLDELLDGVPADERAAIVGGNAIDLYGLSVELHWLVIFCSRRPSNYND